MRQAVIVSTARTGLAKSYRGGFNNTHGAAMAGHAIKHAIARMGTEMEPARGLWWYAAHALDRDHADASRQASIAKAHITDRAMDTARQSVELHGGYGFTWECEVQMWFKRIMFDRAFLGTPEQHRERSARLGGW